MEGAAQSYKCACNSCGVHLEFPFELAGTSIDCPQCHSETPLIIPESIAAEKPAASPPLSLEVLLAAFQGTVKWPRISLLYSLGLLLVTAAIVVLPLIYMAMLGFAAYVVYWWATRFSFLVSGTSYGIYILLLQCLLYFAPLFAGAVVLFFMVKPFLARRPRYAQPLALNPGSEPLLFAFVTRICKTIGAPFPTRIDVDCNLNAAASFRRGFKSFFGDDLVLTLGLPLVAGTNITQLAGIIAHELGHFTQGFGMRLGYVIDRVNGWFVRVVYQRDQWDLMLEEAAMEAEDWRTQLIIAIARLGVWFSRRLLKLVMFLGIGISSFISRQKEFDADRYEIELAGSHVFEQNTVRLEVLALLVQAARDHMQTSWNTDHALPDNFPAFLLLHDCKLPDETRTAIADRVGLRQSHFFATHPASGDRIRCARRANKPGVFALDVPASQLFSNFDVIAKQVTVLHYTEDFGIALPFIRFRPPESFFEKSAPQIEEPPQHEIARAELEKKFGPTKLKLSKTK